MTSDQYLSLPPASRERLINSKLASVRAVLNAWPQRSSDYHATMRGALHQQFYLLVHELKTEIPEDISCRYAALTGEDIEDAISLHLISTPSHSVASDSSAPASSSNSTVVPEPASISKMPPLLSGRPIPSVSPASRRRDNQVRSAVQESQESLREKACERCVKDNHECRGSMSHSCVRCHGRHLACNTSGSAVRSSRTAQKNRITSKRKRTDEEENLEATGETTMTAKANALSRTKSARRMVIDEDGGEQDELVDEQDPALARVKTKDNVNEERTDSESNDETREESTSPEPRKSIRLRNAAPAKAAAYDSSDIQKGSAALIKGTSAGVHLSRSKLPVMDRDDYHARLKNRDRVLAQLAEAQSNKVKCIACQTTQEPALCVLNAAKCDAACLRCRFLHYGACSVMKSPAHLVDRRALQLPAMEPVVKHKVSDKKHARVDSEVERPQPNKRARPNSSPSKSTQSSAQKPGPVRESKGAKASGTVSDALESMSKKRFERYAACDDVIEAIASQLRAARRTLDDAEDGITRLRRVIRDVVQVERGIVQTKEATDGATGESAFPSYSPLPSSLVKGCSRGRVEANVTDETGPSS